MQLVLMGAAFSGALLLYARGDRWSFALRPVDWWMLALGFFGSVVPIVLVLARGGVLDVGAIASAFPLFKYLLLWLFVRLSVRTDADVAMVLVAAVAAACCVAALAVPEGLGIGPLSDVTRALTGGTTAAVEGRAFTLLGSAISTGAVLAMCATVAFGLAVSYRSLLAAGVTAMLVVGSVATGQATSVVAVATVLAVAAWRHKVFLKTVTVGVPFAVVAALVMAPILQSRLADVPGRSFIPQSWLVRWVNVSELYWPDIRSGGWLWGVNPDSVVVPPDSWRTDVFLESGYLWTLWVGGLPLFLCFAGLLISIWRSLNVESSDPTFQVALTTGSALVVFMAIFNVIDPHLTLRGGADLFYILVPVALAATPMAVKDSRPVDRLRLVIGADGEEPRPTARIQVGEIGGELLGASGWAAVANRSGGDRGFDISVKDEGITVAEARVYVETDRGRYMGLMLHPVRAVDEQARSLAWRGIVQCAASLRFHALTLPATSEGLDRLDRPQLAALAKKSERHERRRSQVGDRLEVSSRDATQNQSPPPVGVRLHPQQPLPFTRRFLDVSAALGVLFVFAPIGAVLALLVRRSSPGPVFFRQMRVGEGGRLFVMLKFRSMVSGAEVDPHRASVEASFQNDRPDEKLDDDPRITPVGAFMRAWSLDEVPQLINVLRGDMTLVGPRPSLLWETSLYSPRARRRLRRRPGLAGLWQASGRGDLSTAEMLELDLEYVDSASWSTDLRLLARTGLAVIKRTGAR